MRSHCTVRTISPYSSSAATSILPSAAESASFTPSFEDIRGAEWRTAAISALDGPDAADLALELHHPVEQRLGGRRAAGDVDVDRHDAVAAAYDAVAVVVIAAAVGAAAHADHVLGVRHLVVDLAQRRGHLVAQRAGDDHHVRLARAGARGDPEALHVVARHVDVDHLDRAAGEPERHPPQAAGAGPLEQVLGAGHEETLVIELRSERVDERAV